MGLKLMLLGVLFSLCLADDVQPEGTVDVCPPTTVDCACDKVNDETVVVQINISTVQILDPDTGMFRCIAVGNPLSVCENINCVIIPNSNFDILFQKGRKIPPSNFLEDENNPKENPDDLYRTGNSSGKIVAPSLLDSLLSPFYPIEFTIPAKASNEDSHHRLAKRSYGDGYLYGGGSCMVPQLRNSDVTCWKWPNWQSCKQSCSYGYGLSLGGKTRISNTYTCRNSENVWKPSNIKDCQNYLNCKVHLKGPGDLECHEPTRSPVTCDISCDEYDDHLSTGHFKFVCDNRMAKSKLPHCAYIADSAPGYRMLNPPSD